MEEFVVKDGKKLRLGYTTGSCAAAAAKAAAWQLLTGRRAELIKIITPKGIELELEVKDAKAGEGFASCAIEKDSGDDPDVTGGSLIYARVEKTQTPGISIDGGKGVGRVTKRGLDQPVGTAAINSVPRQMIKENVEEICRATDYRGGLNVIISAPRGEELAQKTFNPRLGIQGGISILGTSGIVEPMSEQALVDTIKVELKQRRAEGAEYALITPGNYGSDYIKSAIGIDPVSAVLCSNFVGDTLDICAGLGFSGVLLIGHIGKLVKIAGGMLNTHSKYGDCRMEIMAARAGAEGLDRAHIAEMLECATCDDALRILSEQGLFDETLAGIAKRIDFIMSEKAAGRLITGALLFSREYGFLCETAKAAELLARIKKG